MVKQRFQEVENILKLQNYLLDLAIAQSRNQEAFISCPVEQL
ncbi:hypothetical protein [Okeania sp. KiyG1]|nr:hypothetical protein [Okeania sp. KiyG1]